MIAKIRAKLNDDLRHAWRLWSIRLNGIGLAILTWVQIDPVSALGVWNMMPAPVQAVLPHHFVTYAGMALFALSMLARFVRQPKVEAARDRAANP